MKRVGCDKRKEGSTRDRRRMTRKQNKMIDEGRVRDEECVRRKVEVLLPGANEGATDVMSGRAMISGMMRMSEKDTMRT